MVPQRLPLTLMWKGAKPQPRHLLILCSYTENAGQKATSGLGGTIEARVHYHPIVLSAVPEEANIFRRFSSPDAYLVKKPPVQPLQGRDSVIQGERCSGDAPPVRCLVPTL